MDGPPSGSRLSCGRLTGRRKAVGRQSVPGTARLHAFAEEDPEVLVLVAILRRMLLPNEGSRATAKRSSKSASRSGLSSRSFPVRTGWKSNGITVWDVRKRGFIRLGPKLVYPGDRHAHVPV